MNYKTIDNFNNELQNTTENLYLCCWNGNQIIEIHTLKTLIETYEHIKENYFCDGILAYSGKTWKEIFMELDSNFIKEKGINIDYHIEDNMEIKRIA